MSPMAEVEQDLDEVRRVYPECPRVFLLNGDAFVMSYDKLKRIALKIREYLPSRRIISSYAGITNIRNKTVEQLADLRTLGITKLTIGLETGDDEVRSKLKKGYTAAEFVEQCGNIEADGMLDSLIYLSPLGRHG